jgi:hypothetical protein
MVAVLAFVVGIWMAAGEAPFDDVWKANDAPVIVLRNGYPYIL